jgi:hypothetical protein
MAQATITLDAGETLGVVLTVPEDIDISDYEAKIEVRKKPNSSVVLSFDTSDDTITKNDQQLHFSILPSQTTNAMGGEYKWQLMLYNDTDEDDVQIFTSGTFIINKSIVLKDA